MCVSVSVWLSSLSLSLSLTSVLSHLTVLGDGGGDSRPWLATSSSKGCTVKPKLVKTTTTTAQPITHKKKQLPKEEPLKLCEQKEKRET